MSSLVEGVSSQFKTTNPAEIDYITLRQTARESRPTPTKQVKEKPVAYPERNPEEPVPFTAPVVLANDGTQNKGARWAQGENPSEYRAKLEEPDRSFETSHLKFDEENRPINPMGETGIKERGLLGSWGPNNAVDPLVTRYNPETGNLQLVLIKRGDTGEHALPGGMKEKEGLTRALRKELIEEAGGFSEGSPEHSRFIAVTDKLFEGGDSSLHARQFYQGFVDDPRNTDNAWIETEAVHFHVPDTDAGNIPLKGGDDATHAGWYDVEDVMGDASKIELYASHIQIIKPLFDQLALTNKTSPDA